MSCKVCLSRNVRMHNIKNTLLEEIFEKLTDDKIDTVDGESEGLCYICFNELRRCSTLLDTIHKTNDIMNQLSNSGIELTQDIVAILNEKITRRYIITPADVASLPADYQHCPNIVKQEEDDIAGSPPEKKHKVDGKEQFPCDKCDKVFEQKRQLQGHKMSHSRTKKR